MIIGILTHHWVFNYGANLQTLSTVSYLKSHGHIPYVINWVQEDAESHYSRTTKSEMVKVFRSFQEQYYPLTELCRNAKDIADVIKKYGIEEVIIGSDTVWMLHSKHFSVKKLAWSKPTSESVFPNPFWGEFLNYNVNTQVVAYSAATLDIKINDFKSQKEEIGSYLRRFSKITTRDQYTSDVISYFTDGKIVPSITPDPVFGFNNNVSNQLSKFEVLRRFGLPEKYYLIGFQEAYESRATPWAENAAKYLKHRTGIDSYELPRQTGKRLLNINHISSEVLTPLEWYAIIRYSEGFIGQLMHPIVSAMHNAIPFFSLDHYGISKFHHIKVDYTTSKVWQIVKQADMTYRYWHVGGRFVQLPDYHKVVDAFLTEDSERRRIWADKMAKLSEVTMKEAIII